LLNYIAICTQTSASSRQQQFQPAKWQRKFTMTLRQCSKAFLSAILIGASSLTLAQSGSRTVPADTADILYGVSQGRLMWKETQSQSGTQQVFFCYLNNCPNGKTPIGSMARKDYIQSLAAAVSQVWIAVGATGGPVRLWYAEESANYTFRQGPDATGYNWKSYAGVIPSLVLGLHSNSNGGIDWAVLHADDEFGNQTTLTSCRSTPLGTQCSDALTFRGPPVDLMHNSTKVLWATSMGVGICSIGDCAGSTEVVSSGVTGNPVAQVALTEQRMFGMNQTYEGTSIWSCPLSGCTEKTVVTASSVLRGVATGVAASGNTLFFASPANPGASEDGQGLYKCTLAADFTCNSSSVTRISTDVVKGKLLIESTNGSNYLIWAGWKGLNILKF
jgi:hypothetical protein